MRYRIRLAERARTDIAEIVDYIAQDSVGAALTWYEGLVSAIRTLEENPARCPVAANDDVLRIGLRRLLHGNYRVLFAISEDAQTVDVLHVRHGRRREMRPSDLE